MVRRSRPSKAEAEPGSDGPRSTQPGSSGATAWSLLMALVILYTAQTVPMQFYYIGLPAILRDAGFQLEDLAWLGVVFLPWAFKFLWAPMLDRWSGTGRVAYLRWITATQLLVAAVFLVSAQIGLSAGIGPLIAAAMLIACACATQDIATDGWAKLRLSRPQYGSGNAMQGAGAAIGGLIGGAVLLPLYGLVGWAGLHYLLAAFFAAVSLAAVLLNRHLPVPESGPRSAASLMTLFRKPGFWTMITLILVLRLPQAPVLPLLQPIMIDAGMDLPSLGLLNGVWAMAAGLAGSLVAGRIASKAGIRTGLASSVLMVAVATVAFGGLLAAEASVSALGVGYVLIWFAGSAMIVSLYALIMGFADERQGGTDFTFFVCVDAFCMMAGGILGTYIASITGYQTVLVGMGLVLLLSVFGFLRLSILQPTALGEGSSQSARAAIQGG